jgi:hypothetical protein
MALDLVDYEQKAHEAVKAFWGNRNAAGNGEFSELSAMTGLKTFVTALAGHIAAEAARLG